MKILVWGTGVAIRDVLNKYLTLEQIFAFIDNDVAKEVFMGKPVFHPHYLLENEYDCLVVATTHAQEVYFQCKSLGVDLNKVVFLYKNYVFEDLNKDYDFIEFHLGKKSVLLLKEQFERLKSTHHIISSSYNFENSELKNLKSDIDYYITDYVRIKTFEMIVNEMKDVSGDIAELGVFRGDFAQYLNVAFPDKKLYLFDSFEGFDENEAESELAGNASRETFKEAFKRTNVDIVLRKMIHPERVVIKKGYFPDSLEGLESEFAFVSLDVDFEKTTLEGLRYFYPRLSNGGYIFIHDYNCSDDLIFQSVRLDNSIHKAVKTYEKEIGMKLHKVPLCDTYGTLVISK